jgi:hypothetical protein
MHNEYLSLVKVTLRDIDSKGFMAEGDVVVMTDDDTKATIAIAAIKEFDHLLPMVSSIQGQTFHVPDIIYTVELPLVIGDMKDGAEDELVKLVADCEGHQEVLDELVRSVYDKKASDLNNEGPEGQIAELIQELGPQGLGEELANRLNQVED